VGASRRRVQAISLFLVKAIPALFGTALAKSFEKGSQGKTFSKVFP